MMLIERLNFNLKNCAILLCMIFLSCGFILSSSTVFGLTLTDGSLYLSECESGFNATNLIDLISLTPSSCSFLNPFVEQCSQKDYLSLNSSVTLQFGLDESVSLSETSCFLDLGFYNLSKTPSLILNGNSLSLLYSNEYEDSCSLNTLKYYIPSSYLIKNSLDSSFLGGNALFIENNGDDLYLNSLKLNCHSSSFNVSNSITFDRSSYREGQRASLSVHFFDFPNDYSFISQKEFILRFKDVSLGDLNFNSLNSQCFFEPYGSDVQIVCNVSSLLEPLDFYLYFNTVRTFSYTSRIEYLNASLQKNSLVLSAGHVNVSSSKKQGSVLDSVSLLTTFEGEHKVLQKITYSDSIASAIFVCDSSSESASLVFTNVNSGKQCVYGDAVSLGNGLFEVDLVSDSLQQSYGCNNPYVFSESGLYEVTANCLGVGVCAGTCLNPLPFTLPKTFADWYVYLQTNKSFFSYSNDNFVNDCVCNSEGQLVPITLVDVESSLLVDFPTVDYNLGGGDEEPVIVDEESHDYEFIYPTLLDLAITSLPNIPINVSINSSLKELNYTFGDETYTLYDDSLVLMYNFDSPATFNGSEYNVALNKSVSVPNYWYGGNVGSHIVDGDFYTMWNLGNKNSATVTIDLDETQNIWSYLIYCGGDAGGNKGTVRFYDSNTLVYSSPYSCSNPAYNRLFFEKLTTPFTADLVTIVIDYTHWDWTHLLEFQINMPELNDLSLRNTSSELLLGATYTSSGKYGGAYDFDGNRDYLSLGDSLDEFTTGEDKKFSFSVWVKPDSSMTNGIILGKLGNSSCGENQRQYLFRLSDDSKPSFFWFGNLGTSWSYRGVLGSTSITDTQKWYFVTMVYDGSVDTNDGLDRVSIYVDGVKENTYMGYIEGPLLGIKNGSAHLGIGNALNSKGSVCGSYGFDGLIDEVMVWNRSLSSSEVSQLYVSNLQKHNDSQWYLYVNQSVDQVSANYSYQATGVDLDNQYHDTEVRTVKTVIS